jgi:ArsR family transcriptional regulator
MKRVALSCCGPKSKKTSAEKEMDIPEQIQKELEEIGGFDALVERIPPQKTLDDKSKIYHALSDPLRLTILYLIRDQPLCVCVINRFMHLAGSKLSYHLNILKESDLINGEYSGNWIIYSLTEKGRKYVEDNT